MHEIDQNDSSKQDWVAPQVVEVTLSQTEGGLTNDVEGDGGFMGS